MAEIRLEKFDPNRKKLRNKVEYYEDAISRPLDRPPTAWEQLNITYNNFLRKLPRRKRRPSPESLTVFTRQFATLLDAGVPLANCFDSFCEPEDVIHQAMQEVGQKVQAGSRLSSAMRTVPHIFSPIYCGLIESGERTGQLVDVMHTLADDLEKQLGTRRKLIAAMSYPAILILASVACVAWFVTMVLPMLVPMFKSLKVELPLATRILLRSKEIFFGAFGVAAVVWVVSTITYKILSRNPITLRWMHRAIMWIPVFGRLYRTITVTRIIQSLATMLQVGMTMVPCFKACESLTSNAYITYQMGEVKRMIIDGENVSKALAAVNLFPRSATQLVAVGEESSNMIEMLQFAARLLREDCETEIDRMASNIEPLIMGIMGLVVGFIVLGAMLPITQIISNL